MINPSPRPHFLLALAAAVLMATVAVSACGLPDAAPQALQLALAALAAPGVAHDVIGLSMAASTVAVKVAKAMPVEPVELAALADQAMNQAAMAQAGADRAAGESAPMTLAEAAALVRIPACDVLAFRDHGTHVVVVSVAGQKLTTA